MGSAATSWRNKGGYIPTNWVYIPGFYQQTLCPGCFGPWLPETSLYCLAGVSNTVVPVRVYGNLVTNG